MDRCRSDINSGGCADDINWRADKLQDRCRSGEPTAALDQASEVDGDSAREAVRAEGEDAQGGVAASEVDGDGAGEAVRAEGEDAQGGEAAKRLGRDGAYETHAGEADGVVGDSVEPALAPGFASKVDRDGAGEEVGAEEEDVDVADEADYGEADGSHSGAISHAGAGDSSEPAPAPGEDSEVGGDGAGEALLTTALKWRPMTGPSQTPATTCRQTTCPSPTLTCTGSPLPSSRVHWSQPISYTAILHDDRLDIDLNPDTDPFNYSMVAYNFPPLAPCATGK